MNVGLLGGTFDPVHCGHLAVARAARDRFALDRVYFVPAGRPPHRGHSRLTPYEHRYAMVALACAGEPNFVPSAAEGPSRRGPSYSIHTVRRFRRELGTDTRLFFIVGADAFLEFRTWRQWRQLLAAAVFVIASRPGFSLDQIRRVFPKEDLRFSRPSPGSQQVTEFVLRDDSAWVMTDLASEVSGTDVRRRGRARETLAGLVPEVVAEYIAKESLYS